MKYIKNDRHGILAVTEFTQFQKAAGWYEIDINEEIKIQPPQENKSLDDMTKQELEDFGREVGVELDKRKSKNNMIKDLLEWQRLQTS